MELLMQLWAWLMSHQVVLGGLVVGVLDFLFVLKPDWASNGLLHWLYLLGQKMKDQALKLLGK